MSGLSTWQQQDGFPTDEYFAAVVDALQARGVTLADSFRDDLWDWAAEIDPDIVAAGPQKWARETFHIGWRCDETSEPTHGDDFEPIHGFWTGWHWVGCSKPGALGDRAENFDLAWLAEPNEVASAAAALVLAGVR